MSRIKLLTPDIYNKISAGEVIENPAGVVKELVENCVDAGANRIVIEVEGGGFDLISVTDNGCGIQAEDVDYAFLKHATSKVDSVDDLYYLQTLGFRGEALASISAVAKIKLTTCTNQSESAVSVNVENGEILSKQFVSANVGTKIEVRDLFYNTPARKKFLKTPAREGGEITKFVTKFILTNPNLQVVYTLDGKTVYHSKGNGLEDAIFTVYGDDCLDKCIKVSSSWQLMTITGYVGAPNFSKPNKNSQTLAVNGRYVSDVRVASAIMQAYKPYLMTRQYPFYVLFLEIPCDRIDVNVHPKKSEIHFQNHDRVASAFYSAVSKALTEYMDTQRDNPFGLADTAVDSGEQMSFSSFDFGDYAQKKGLVLMNEHQAQDVLDIENATQALEDKQQYDEQSYLLSQKLSVDQARRAIGLPTDDYNGKKRKTEVVGDPPYVPSMYRETDEGELLYNRTRILGVAFRTYIILEIDDKVIFVDQHAAHERILFDQYMERHEERLQQLMFPYVFKTTDDESEFIESNLDNIIKAGIEVQPFGQNTYRIVAISSLLLNIRMDQFVEYILSSVDELKLDSDQLIVEKIAQRACKAAVKAGDVLNKYDIIYILKKVLDGSVLLCPHGRPVTTMITKTQLEKMFKRKV